MLKCIVTPIPKQDNTSFQSFSFKVELTGLKIAYQSLPHTLFTGGERKTANLDYLCYLYEDEDEILCERLEKVIGIYGSLHSAYAKFLANGGVIEL